jgi:hypothetical protein
MSRDLIEPLLELNQGRNFIKLKNSLKKALSGLIKKKKRENIKQINESSSSRLIRASSLGFWVLEDEMRGEK